MLLPQWLRLKSPILFVRSLKGNDQGAALRNSNGRLPVECRMKSTDPAPDGCVNIKISDDKVIGCDIKVDS